MTGAALLANLRGQGLRLFIGTDAQLRVAPKGSITPTLDELIRSSKASLVEALGVEQQDREDLQRRIREMAERWEYTEEDLVEALAAAEADPLHWSLACQFDEEAAARGRKVGRRQPWG